MGQLSVLQQRAKEKNSKDYKVNNIRFSVDDETGEQGEGPGDPERAPLGRGGGRDPAGCAEKKGGGRGRHSPGTCRALCYEGCGVFTAPHPSLG